MAVESGFEKLDGADVPGMKTTANELADYGAPYQWVLLGRHNPTEGLLHDCVFWIREGKAHKTWIFAHPRTEARPCFERRIQAVSVGHRCCRWAAALIDAIGQCSPCALTRYQRDIPGAVGQSRRAIARIPGRPTTADNQGFAPALGLSPLAGTSHIQEHSRLRMIFPVLRVSRNAAGARVPDR